MFDKLTAPVEETRATMSVDGAVAGGAFRFYTVPRLDRYNPGAVRSVLLRDLGWLFNTASIAIDVDLSETPEVRTSVLNFGVPDLAGKSNSRRLLEQRARESWRRSARSSPGWRLIGSTSRSRRRPKPTMR
ncbi:hypothetical protein AB5I41_09315 [Sphingomonas sp. MMS24-JH45]